MKLLYIILAYLLLSTSVVYATTEEEISTITNSGVLYLSPTQEIITRQEVRQIFTLRTRYWSDGSKIIVVHLPISSKEHQQFVKYVLDMKPSTYNRFIELQLNSGYASVYKEAISYTEMLKYVQGKPGSIGYITKDYILVNGLGHVDVLKIID